MSNKAGRSDSRFSMKHWWWALLFSFILLYTLMLMFRWGPIEADVQSRSQAALNSQGFTWATTDLENQGRDVILRGQAPDDKTRQQAIELVKQVEGVRVIKAKVDLAPLELGQMAWKLGPDQRVLLQGEVPNEASEESLIEAIRAQYPTASITSQLTVKPVLEAGWMKSYPDVLRALAPVENWSFDWDADKAIIKGVVRTEAAQAQVGSHLSRVIGQEVSNKVELKAYRPTRIAAQYNNGRMILKGNVSSQDSLAKLLTAAEAKVGAGNIINQIDVGAEVEPTDWADQAIEVFSAIPEGGAMQINSQELVLLGMVDTEVMKEQVITKAQQAIEGDNIELRDELSVRVPSIEPTDSEEQAEAKRQALAKAEAIREQKRQLAKEQVNAKKRKQAVEVCQRSIKETMQGQRIQFASGSASIKEESFPLLNKLLSIVKVCGSDITNTEIYITGHTDSRGDAAFNQVLSERRANAVKHYLMEGGLSEGMMTAIGQGETQPMATNKTEQGRSMNRRIQFEIK